MSNGKEEVKEIDYFLATKYGERDFMVFCKQEQFILTEQELLNLIKICLVNKRAIEIGKKLLAIYETSYEEYKDIALKKLIQIGVIQKDEKPMGERMKVRKK